MLIKRLVPNHTQLDYAAARLQIVGEEKNDGRVLDKKRSLGAIQAMYSTADELNSAFESNDNVSVLHDLRLSASKGMSHIDHIIITSNYHVFLVESRTDAFKLEIDVDDQFISRDAEGEPCLIASPVQQIKLNKTILKRALKKMSGAKRFAWHLKPIFHSYVLINSPAVIANAVSDDISMFISTEKLIELIEKQVKKNAMLSFFTAMTSDNLRQISRQLANLHTPQKIRFSNKFRHILMPVPPLTQGRQI